MILPPEAREKFAAHAQRKVRELLAENFPGYGFPLHPPTAKQVTANYDAVVEFVRSWQGKPFVTWETKDWTRAGQGRQTVPVRAQVDTVAELIDAADLGTWWRELQLRAAVITAAGGQEAMLATYPKWKSLPLEDLELVGRLVDWLVANPDSGLLPRAVPVEGVHSKWLEGHRSLITALVEARSGTATLGLSSKPSRVRLRPSGSKFSDIEMLIDELHLLPVPSVVLVLENEQTFLALPPREGVTYILGSGYRAISTLKHPVFTQADGPRLVYFGDLDADGYAILDGIRATHPAVESLLMDESAVRDWLKFGVADRDFQSREYSRLHGTEFAGLDLLIRSGHLRIEQERIPLAAAVAEFDAMLAS